MQLKQTADATTSATPNAVTPMSGTRLNVFNAIFFADKNNTDDIFIGPTNAASLYPVSPGQWYEIDLPGDAFGPGDLNTWYVKSATPSQTYRIAYR